MAASITARTPGIGNKEIAILSIEKIKAFIYDMKISTNDEYRAAKELRDAVLTLGSFVANTR